MSGYARVAISVCATIPIMLGLLIPSSISAQPLSEDEVLKAQIRVDLMTDPRTQSLSSDDVSSLVDALAADAKSQGIALQYLETRTQTDFTQAFAESFTQPNPSSGYPSFGVIVAAFLILIGVGVLIYWRGLVPRIEGLAR